MSSGAGLHVILLLGLLAKGQTALIQTQQTVVAAVGEDARLSCQLLQPKEVHQVTWQKIFPEGEKNVVTYSKHGSRVTPDFRDKVEVKDAGLQSSSIVIRDVTEQDGGCYLCFFNSFPDGALTGKTCLRVLSGHKEVLMMIPEVKQTSADDFSLTVVLTCVCVVTVIITTFIIIVVIWLLKSKNSQSRSDSEKIKTPQKEKIDVHGIITPLIKNEDEHTRLRTSSKKKSPSSVHPSPSHLTPKSLF